MTEQPLLAPLAPEQWDDDLAPMRGAGGAPLNIFATLAHHPKLLKRWLVFGNHVLAKSTLLARDRELVILRTGWRCRAPYEWAQHVLIAHASGLTDDEIRRVIDGPDADGWEPFDALLLRAADELHDDACVSEATYRAIAERYDAQQMLDLVFAIGQYHLVSMALNTFRVERDDGLTDFPVPTR